MSASASSARLTVSGCVLLPLFLLRSAADSGRLQPYAEREAMGQNWLKNVENGKYFAEEYVAHLDLPSSEDTLVVILTTKRILLVKVAKLKVGWDVPISDLSTISLEASGISASIVRSFAAETVSSRMQRLTSRRGRPSSPRRAARWPPGWSRSTRSSMLVSRHPARASPARQKGPAGEPRRGTRRRRRSTAAGRASRAARATTSSSSGSCARRRRRRSRRSRRVGTPRRPRRRRRGTRRRRTTGCAGFASAATTRMRWASCFRRACAAGRCVAPPTRPP